MNPDELADKLCGGYCAGILCIGHTEQKQISMRDVIAYIKKELPEVFSLSVLWEGQILFLYSINEGCAETYVYSLLAGLQQNFHKQMHVYVGSPKYAAEKLSEAVCEVIQLCQQGLCTPSCTMPHFFKQLEPTSHHTAESIKRTVDILLRSCCEKVTLQFVADYLGLSPSYLSARFKRDHRINFSAYVHNYKMDQAALYLKQTDCAVREIGGMLGYADPVNFSRLFKKYHQLSPSAYRIAQLHHDSNQ